MLTDLPKVLAVDGEESAGHGGTVGGADGVGPARDFARRHVHPREVARPGEAADLERFRIAVEVLERLVVDDVDDGHQHGLPVLLDAVQQRLQPTFGALGTTTKKSTADFSFCFLAS